jgi:hypothetical protein
VWSKLGADIKARSQDYPFTLVTLLVGGYVIWGVPQISNLWMQMPPMAIKFLRFGTEYLLFVMALIWFYLPAVCIVAPWRVDDNQLFPPGLGRVGKILFYPSALASCWLGILGSGCELCW